jgi:hypothetical protein
VRTGKPALGHILSFFPFLASFLVFVDALTAKAPDSLTLPVQMVEDQGETKMRRE